MALDTLPPSRRTARRTGDGREPDDRDRQRHGLPSRALLVALLLACATLMVVDKTGGDDSPVEPVRTVAGEVLGPAQAGVSTLLAPLVAVPEAFRTNAGLRDELSALEARNSELERRLRTSGYDEQRLEQLDALRAIAGDLGYALAPARVVGYGSAQSFSNTVTIDAGSDAGLRPDMTVVNGDGLVGRVTAVTSHTATVLLVVDPESTVGGRLGDSIENGMVRGHGGLAEDSPLDLQLIDHTVMPRTGQTVVTWGSEGGAPYVAGVPIGEVTKVYESLREGTYRAVVEPFVDFTALDQVGVVVPSGTDGRVIEADGSLRDGSR